MALVVVGSAGITAAGGWLYRVEQDAVFGRFFMRAGVVLLIINIYRIINGAS